MGKKKKNHDEHIDETWLIPYADMLTLLLALFIVMFAMSKIDNEKFNKAKEQLNVIFSGGSGIHENAGSEEGGIIETPSNGQIEQDQMIKIKNSLEENIKNKGYGDKIVIDLNNEGLQISIQDAVLFNSGDATILPESNPFLVEISKMISSLDNKIIVTGHTDNKPIKNSKFRSNWDLSAIRAINVMNFMVDSGGINPKNVGIRAYGEYEPKFDNATEEGRAKNRRVEISIARKYELEEKNK
ncbi:MAG: flagellar motor protein MotB [Clostridium sp.]